MARSDELEMKLKRWYDRVPHLSSYSREWLSNNIWWMALIGVVFNAVGLYRVVNVLLAVFGMERPGVDIDQQHHAHGGDPSRGFKDESEDGGHQQSYGDSDHHCGSPFSLRG